MMHDTAWPHMVRVCRQLLEDDGINTKLTSLKISKIQHLWDIMFQGVFKFSSP